jgi:hypothetical protein
MEAPPRERVQSVPRLSGGLLLLTVILAALQPGTTLVLLIWSLMVGEGSPLFCWSLVVGVPVIELALLIIIVLRRAAGALLAALVCLAVAADDLFVMIALADRFEASEWILLSSRIVIMCVFCALYSFAYVTARSVQGAGMPSGKQILSSILCTAPWLLAWFWIRYCFLILAPQFLEIFNDFEVELPRMTIMIIDLSREFHGLAAPTVFSLLAALLGVLMHSLLLGALGLMSAMLFTTPLRFFRRLAAGVGWMLLVLCLLLLSIPLMVPLVKLIESVSEGKI